MKVKLQGTSPYLWKDQIKSDKATCFIGMGSARSSTNSYRVSWGQLANKQEYTSDDVVFVSAEGNRAGRVVPPYHLIEAAAKAGATFITDDAANRQRDYNVGEREVAAFLKHLRYKEITPGTWLPVISLD